jgi:hypothetical protein
LQLRHCTVRRSALPAAIFVGNLAQRAHEIELFDLPVAVTCREIRAAERAHSFCLPGFHSACAPQAGQGCFSGD